MIDYRNFDRLPGSPGVSPAPLSPFTYRLLQPGDCLLYSPTDVFDWAVALKTFTRVSHVEIFVGGHKSVASRNGKGVREYLARETDVAAVRRPGPEFDLEKAVRWFDAEAEGQGYGLRTLLSFIFLNSSPVEGHMICSEFAAEFYKAGGAPCFARDWPSYRTPPSYFVATPRLTTIWDNGKLFQGI